MANEEYKFPDEVEAKTEAAPEPEFNIEIEELFSALEAE